jgi:hypothetical protein
MFSKMIGSLLWEPILFPPATPSFDHPTEREYETIQSFRIKIIGRI